MATRKRERSPRSCAQCPIRGEQQKLICELVEKVGSKLKDDSKASVSDYIRLLQIQKEMEEGQPKEIQVTWVEQPKESGAVK